MTAPNTMATGRAVETNGIGKVTTAHLNLTKTVADVSEPLHHRHRDRKRKTTLDPAVKKARLRERLAAKRKVRRESRTRPPAPPYDPSLYRNRFSTKQSKSLR